MPLSERAYAGLKAAVEWNPSMAHFLLYVFKNTPHLVKYKDDLYGPLSLLLIMDVVRKPIFHRIGAPINPRDYRVPNDLTVLARLPPFPKEKLDDCKVFGDEWKQRKITKQEVADALEKMLLELS